MIEIRTPHKQEPHRQPEQGDDGNNLQLSVPPFQVCLILRRTIVPFLSPLPL